MAPNIQDKISGGSAIITGLSDMNEARDISIVLRAGALPAPVTIAEERTVGPSLGRDSVEAGKTSVFWAFTVVFLFMLWYYRASGGIADLAMMINMFLLLAILAMFQFTLTMPGIAGMILTIGMAVDANVLIFERIREELALGKTVRAAIETGFERATVTIIDSNVTTAIAGVVLLVYGTGSIKGFALTLTVGIIVNLFAAIFVTRLVVRRLHRWPPTQEIECLMPKFFAKTTIDFVSPALDLSSAFPRSLSSPASSPWAFAAMNWSIDFRGGLDMQVRFAQPALRRPGPQCPRGALNVGEVKTISSLGQPDDTPDPHEGRRK